MNFHQTPEEIIKHATAEQRIMWNYIFLRFGEKIGLQQFYFIGNFAGSELSIYSANKMYFALMFGAGAVAAPADINIAYIAFYDAANAIELTLMANLPVWDTTAAALKYQCNSLNTNNTLFSRITAFSYSRMFFIGYRLSV